MPTYIPKNQYLLLELIKPEGRVIITGGIDDDVTELGRDPDAKVFVRGIASDVPEILGLAIGDVVLLRPDPNILAPKGSKYGLCHYSAVLAVEIADEPIEFPKS